MASLGTSFGNSGATPQGSYGGVFNSNGPSTTPYGKALGSAVNNGLGSIASGVSNLFKPPAANAQSLTGSPASSPTASIYSGVLNQPSTALKSTTITQPDGTTVKQEHHTPDTGGASTGGATTSTGGGAQATPPIYDATGHLTDYGRAQNATRVQTESQTQQNPVAPATTFKDSTGTTQPLTQAGAISAGIGANTQLANSLAEVAGNGGSLDTQTGRGAIVGQRLGQVAAGYQNAASELAPVQVSPGSTLTSPTGTPLYGLGAEGNGSNAYQNFANLQFNTATGQALSKQANDLTTAANQTDQNFNTLSQAASGLNLSDYPTINSLSQALQKQGGNAGQVAALNEAYNALTTSLGQIINQNSDALTPTLISKLIGNQSINTLSPAQLQTLYKTVQQTIATKISTTQQQALQAEKSGTNFNNGASNGVTTNPDGTLQAVSF